MSLLDLYNNSSTSYLGKAREQASPQEGRKSPYTPGIPGIMTPVNFMKDDWQTGFIERGANNTSVVQSLGDDTTAGNFTTAGLNHYQDLMANNKLIQFRGKLVQLYNARVNSTYYTTINGNTRGVMLTSANMA